MKRTFKGRFVGIGRERPAWVDKPQNHGGRAHDAATIAAELEARCLRCGGEINAHGLCDCGRKRR